MKQMHVIAAAIVVLASWAMAEPPKVKLVRVPDGGIQPQVAVDERGTVHLLFYKGPEAGGDLFYVRSGDGGATWSAPVRVNSVPGSAIAVGTIRGAQLALGAGGRVHVVWNGSKQAAPPPGGGSPQSLVSYSSR